MPKEGLYLLGEQRRLLEGGEVAAAVRLAPVADVAEALFGPAPAWALELVGEDRAAGGDVDEVAWLERALEPACDVVQAFPVEARGRGARAREPVEHEVVEQRVAGHRVTRVGPVAQLLRDPGREPGGGVDKGVADRLGPRAVLSGIPGVMASAAGHGVKRRLLAGRWRILGGWRERWHEVDAGDVVWILLAQARTDARAPVAALGALALIAEPRHEPGPCARDPLDAPARLGRLVAPPVAWQGRHDTVEAGRGEQLECAEVLDDRAGPAVREHEGEGVRLRRTGVQEVDPETVDRRAELGDRIQSPLERTPVVAVCPVGAERLQLRERDTLVGLSLRVRPAGGAQPAPKVVQLVVLDPQREALDRGRHRRHVGFIGTPRRGQRMGSECRSLRRPTAHHPRSPSPRARHLAPRLRCAGDTPCPGGTADR